MLRSINGLRIKALLVDGGIGRLSNECGHRLKRACDRRVGGKMDLLWEDRQFSFDEGNDYHDPLHHSFQDELISSNSTII